MITHNNISVCGTYKGISTHNVVTSSILVICNEWMNLNDFPIIKKLEHGYF